MTGILLIVIIGIAGYYIKFNGILLALSALILGMVYWIMIKRLLSGTEKIKERHRLQERLETMAVSMGIRTIVFLLGANMLMTTLSILILFIPKSPKKIGIIGVSFFGLGLVQSIYFLYIIMNKKTKFQ